MVKYVINPKAKIKYIFGTAFLTTSAFMWNIMEYSMNYFLTFKYINRNVLISMILQLNFLIYKTFDIYTEGSKEMLNTMNL